MNLKAIFLLVSMFSSGLTFAATTEAVVLTEGKFASVMMLDNPTAAGPYASADLFSLLKTPVTQSHYGAWEKIVKDQYFSIECGVPLVMQPSGEKFSSCDVEVKAGPAVSISESNGTATYMLTGEGAKVFYDQMENNGAEVTYKSPGKSIEIKSSSDSLQVTIRKTL